MRNKDRDVLRPRAFQYAMRVAFGKIILRLVDVNHEIFLDHDCSDELIRIRPGLLFILKYTYVEDFASIASICLYDRNTGKAGEEPLRKCI
jgi:hypothetical protein